MKFDLTKPCNKCPFRTDLKPYIWASRAREICHSILGLQQSFACHKTTKFDEDSETIYHEKEQHCAGALIFLEHMERPNQMMRIMERIGMYDRSKLDMTSPVYRTDAAMIAAHRKKVIK